MNVTIFRRIIKLCEEYQKQNCLTPSEYIALNAEDEEEEVQFNFLNLQRHNKILEQIVEHFIKYNAITIHLNIIRFKSLFYILIFAFDPESHGTKNIFIVSKKITHVEKVLLYYSDEENQIRTAQIAYSHFGNEYVLNNIVHPILNNKKHFEELFYFLIQHENNLYKKEATIPIEMNVSKKAIKKLIAPANTPVEIDQFKSTPIPKTTYLREDAIQTKLSKEYEKNKKRAVELLEKARILPDYKISPKPRKPEPEQKLEKFKRPKRMPLREDVPIKANLTTIIREAALYAKEKESCIKEINEILKGGVDTELVKSLEREIRYDEERRQTEEIERKRLKCLLSHEEAIIAKCQLKANKKMKYNEMLKERDELRKKLIEWKEKEREEYKMKIIKAQESNKNAKESERKMIENKQCNAKILQWECKQLLNKAMEEKEKELAKKIQIIQEIKVMHQVRRVDNTKEFDKTECTNLGLLCEMSIAELEERLHLMKLEAQRKLDERRQQILRKKEEKKKMIQDAKEFIEQHRSVRLRPKKQDVKVMEESEDIKLLRKRIEDAKRIRKACTMCPCIPCPDIVAHSNK